MNIYIDIIFIENLLMNYIIMYVTGIVLKYKIKNKYIIEASIIGSLYATLMYLNIIKDLNKIILKFLLSVTMVYVGYRSKNIKELTKDLLIFYFISFSFGGVAFFMLYYIKPEEIKIIDGNYIGLYPLKILILSGTIASIIIIIVFSHDKKIKKEQDLYCQIELFEGKDKIKGFIDSGNMLKEPITNNPVIIIEYEEIKKYYSEEKIKYIESVMKGGELIYERENMPKIRIIPFKTIGKENSIMIGIKKEKIHIYYKEEKIEVKNIVIGIYDGKLMKSGKSKAILGIDVIERGKRKNESSSYY